MISASPHSQSIQTPIDGPHRNASRSRAVDDSRRLPEGNDAINTTGPVEHERRSTYRFLRHYAEMVVVMFAGMFVLMAPAGWVFGAFGTTWSRLSPAMYTFAMALTMTGPMVAWMRYRGHGWRPNAEMAASMLVPTFAAMAVLATGVATKSALTVPEHAAMLVGMLIAMVLRRDEYSAAPHGHAQPAIAA